MILTEAEVVNRLRAAVAEFPSMTAFAKAHRVDPSPVAAVLGGYYNASKGSAPPSLLLAIGVRKRVVYELIGDHNERAA